MKTYYTLEKQGLVTIRQHPDYPIFLLNYTPRTQYKSRWCHELIHARGLVVAKDGEILARPLPKFFNHYEIKGELEEDFELYDKMDGSLVIMFYYKNNRIFCTRGSFTSVQAARAHKIFEQKYNHVIVNKECTYCFEVIYPENKIVVDYGNIEELFLISITHTQTGKEVNIDASEFKTVSKIKMTENSIQDLLNNNIPNKEGYVIKYKNGFRMKLKFHNYISKHKSKTLSANSIKRSMQKMENINLENVPDECYEEVKQIQSELEEQFKCKKQMFEEEYKDIVRESNGDIVEAIKQSQHSSILFAIHRCKSYDKLVWKLL